jgi:hypothetical protein
MMALDQCLRMDQFKQGGSMVAGIFDSAILRFPVRAVKHVLWKTGIEPACNRFIWNKIQDDRSFHLLHSREFEFFKNLPVRFANRYFSEYIALDSAKWSKQQEYVLLIEDALVEPRNCLVCKPPNKFVMQSTTVEIQIQPMSALWSRATSHLESAVLYDGYASKNYYHHIADAVNNLHLLKECSFPPDMPFIINRSVWESPFFQHLRQRDRKFGSINWRIQEKNEWLNVGELYRLRSATQLGENWLKTREMYNPPVVESSERIFLSRDPKKVGRTLRNETEVERMLQRKGFRKVYAENLDLDAQMRLFASTKYLVALHGAGLIQQIFMNYGESHVIEIMPSNYMMPHYYWLAFTLGLRGYDVVIGGTLGRDQSFLADLASVEAAVDKMLRNQYSGKMYGETYVV